MARLSFFTVEIIENIKLKSKEKTAIELFNWFKQQYKHEMTFSGFYRLLDKEKIKTLKLNRKEKLIPKKAEKKITWSKSEDLFLIEEMEKKKNITYIDLAIQLNNKFKNNRTYQAIKQRCSFLKITIRNEHNENLGTDFFHLKELIKKYNLANGVLKKIISENNIKLYKRNSFNMIHLDDIEILEKKVKEYKNKTIIAYKRKGFLTASQCENLLYLSKEQIIKKARAGLIKYIKEGNNYFFTKEAIQEYKKNQNELIDKYYNSKEMSNILNIGIDNCSDYAILHKIAMVKYGSFWYYLKQDVDNFFKYKKNIKKDYFSMEESMNILNRAEKTLRAYKREYSLRSAYYEKKVHYLKEDILKLKKILIEQEKKQVKKNRQDNLKKV